jgi:hypothetical protein
MSAGPRWRVFALPQVSIAMTTLFTFFNGDNAALMAGVVVFTTCFLVARLARARQGIAFAFAFAPLLVIFAIETALTLG